jgi:hypothetical protein
VRLPQLLASPKQTQTPHRSGFLGLFSQPVNLLTSQLANQSTCTGTLMALMPPGGADQTHALLGETADVRRYTPIESTKASLPTCQPANLPTCLHMRYKPS